MKKIIIKYADDIAPEQVIKVVGEVIKEGRISGDSYCYATVYRDVDMDESGILITAELTEKRTDVFKVMKMVESKQ